MYTLTFNSAGTVTAVSRHEPAPTELLAGEYEATEEQYNNPHLWVPSGGQLVKRSDADAVQLAAAKSSALLQIDADVDRIYVATIGNRQAEYDRAESEAKEYKAAGYPATPVPATVQGYADAKKWTPTQAADDILTTATSWRAVQADIRANRLARKEDVRTALEVASVNTLLETWALYVRQVRSSLGV
jgi:hypothetical protein